MTLADAIPPSDTAVRETGGDIPLLVLCLGQVPTETQHLLNHLPCPYASATTADEFEHLLCQSRPANVLVISQGETTLELTAVRRAAEADAAVIVVGPPAHTLLSELAVREGARRYLPAPVSPLVLIQELALEGGASGRKVSVRIHGFAHAKRDGEGTQSFCGMMFNHSNIMQDVVSKVRKVAPTSATVFLTGESGTGKEVIAEAIHSQSERATKPFLPINCGAIAPQLIESELFGHEKGSFTGALREHRGVFERADSGTLFLDEVTDLPMDLQVKLLRVLETRRFFKVGSEREQKTDVRVIAATNKCPETEVENKRLRPDLLYRLKVFPIALPPLRQREGDVNLLAQHFLDELNAEDHAEKAFTPEALSFLEHYAWPGNLRELKNVVQRSHIMAERLIGPDDLPSEITSPHPGARRDGSTLTFRVGCSVAEVEKELIYATLNEYGGKKEKAARILGVSMKTLYNRLREYEALSKSPEEPA